MLKQADVIYTCGNVVVEVVEPNISEEENLLRIRQLEEGLNNIFRNAGRPEIKINVR